MESKFLNIFKGNRLNLCFRFGWACNVDSLYKNFEEVGDMPEEILRRGPYKGPVMFIGGELANFLE